MRSNRRRLIRRRRRYRYVWHKMCGVLSIAITKRFKRLRVKLTRAKLEKRAKLSRTKLASRRSGTRPGRSRQTGTRQKGRAKVDWNLTRGWDPLRGDKISRKKRYVTRECPLYLPQLHLLL